MNRTVGRSFARAAKRLSRRSGFPQTGHRHTANQVNTVPVFVARDLSVSVAGQTGPIEPLRGSRRRNTAVDATSRSFYGSAARSSRSRHSTQADRLGSFPANRLACFGCLKCGGSRRWFSERGARIGTLSETRPRVPCLMNGLALNRGSMPAEIGCPAHVRTLTFGRGPGSNLPARVDHPSAAISGAVSLRVRRISSASSRYSPSRTAPRRQTMPMVRVGDRRAKGRATTRLSRATSDFT